MSDRHIAIIGAGPGGLTLARILQNNGIKYTVFEADETSTSRNQGGMLDLHAEMGQLALREAGLFEAFQKACRPSAEAMKLVKKDGTVPWDENKMELPAELSRNRPEIDRRDLRDLLLDGINPEAIQWNKKLLRVEESKSSVGEYSLHFGDGTEAGPYNVVVGADGAWSKVRPLLTDEKPFYSGITIVELHAKQVSAKYKWLSDYVGAGSCFMFDEGRALIMQHNGDDSIRIYAGLRQPENWVEDCGIDWSDATKARQLLTERYFGDCHDDLKRIITEATDGLTARPLYMLPVGLRWAPRQGITLIGDAAHVMTPFAGVGVNLALTDALSLAKALLKGNNVENCIQEYEEEMFVRAKKYAEKTSKGLRGHFSADGIDHRVALLTEHAKKLGF
ncbi:hypothetical protein F5884DRAFT_670481 [Xylogone sp. PMI_703]|nr:hypothetical protein F5884DRAFT_670481 [Xylogone sp. PMI_703]